MESLNLELFNDLLDEFVEKEVKPLAKEIDETERFPVETVEKMAKLGMLGIIVPTNYGGVGGDYNTYITTVRKLSRACATTGVILSGHMSLCVAPILEFGTEDQKKKYLPKLASGEWLGAFGLTEANAGTDAAGQQTVAVDMGDHYLLNGNKIFITNAGYANVYIVMAMTDKSQGTRGISAFIVDADSEGFSIGKKEEKMGIRGSSTCELIFKDVRVPKENLLGKLGEGFKIAMKTLDGGRIGIAAQALGIAEGAFEEAVAYMKERKHRSSRWSYIRRLAWDRDRHNRSVCHICGERIDFSVQPSTVPLSWEPDHIVPVSVDPSRELDLNNIAPSHMRCNRQRGNGTNNDIGLRSRIW